MTLSPRASMASSFAAIKGALINETYIALQNWDLSLSKRENFNRFRAKNPIGAGSATWLSDVASVLSRRFDPALRDKSLVQLAQHGCDMVEWKPLMLWHMTRDEFLLRDFLQNWLFPVYERGVARIRPADAISYVTSIGSRGALIQHVWSQATTERVAEGLLKMSADFGLLRGTMIKEFATFHLPERSFLYLLHALREETTSPGRIISAPDWRMFLMRPADVEAEILRLHQFKKLDYQVAGSIIELSLPCAGSADYAERMLA